MAMTAIQNELWSRRDAAYAAFQAKLTPTISPETCIGVRVPVLRAYAKTLSASPEKDTFLAELPHTYYDENMLHALLLSAEKDYETALRAVNAFLPYVDNWAVCDILSPKVFGKHREALLTPLQGWVASAHPYTCRFGIEMLMSHYLDADFKPSYLAIPAAVRHEDYYVKMMVAWFFATALAKQWDATVPYLEQAVLPVWEHNKTIQKACESYRLTADEKTYLRSLKR